VDDITFVDFPPRITLAVKKVLKAGEEMYAVAVVSLKPAQKYSQTRGRSTATHALRRPRFLTDKAGLDQLIERLRDKVS